jgi:hypothetical protein
MAGRTRERRSFTRDVEPKHGRPRRHRGTVFSSAGPRGTDMSATYPTYATTFRRRGRVPETLISESPPRFTGRSIVVAGTNRRTGKSVRWRLF